MIHALHLLWIVTLAASFGFTICAVLTVGKRGETTTTTEGAESLEKNQKEEKT